ncbi:MAG: GNAT family N-acetyltransferase [Clostridia bacterium]|nr:GNAT family N-acetyltransferase [Clostridia bacterium]
MREILLENGYRISELGKKTPAELLDLCVRCSDYYLLHCGVSPAEREVREILDDLPPNKGYEDKFVLGVLNNQNKLVGVLDIIRDYVDKGEWTIGLMLLDPLVRGKRLGQTVHSALIDWARGLGAKSFRIGVIEENLNGQAFWKAMGYQKIKDVSMLLTEKTHTVNVMALTFKD